MVPRLARTGDEITAILHALKRRYVGRAVRLAAAPDDQRAADEPQLLLRRSQSDPLPHGVSDGPAMAESLLRRHLDEVGDYPQSVGLSVWGTSAMRTSGDDIAEVLALLGVMPVWDDASRRVIGLRQSISPSWAGHEST